MTLKRKLNTSFNNPISVNTNSSHPVGRDSHRWKEGSGQGMYGCTRSTRLWTSLGRRSTQTIVTHNSGREEYDPLTLSERHLRLTCQSIFAFIKVTTITPMIASNWRMSLKGWLRAADWPSTWNRVKNIGKILIKANLPWRLQMLRLVARERRPTKVSCHILLPLQEEHPRKTSHQKGPWRGRLLIC